MEIYNKITLKKQRQYLRNNSTLAEKLLWEELRKSKLLNIKFRRQYSVNKYILDFFAPEVNLAIELDGEVHLFEENKNRDKIKSDFLKSLGIKTTRFKNDEVIENINIVVEKIKSEILNVRT